MLTMLRLTLALVALQMTLLGVATASDRYQPKHESDALHPVQPPPDRKTSREKIIDAAQVYCQGGTPFDRVHGYLRDFWQDGPDDATQRKVTCKLH